MLQLHNLSSTISALSACGCKLSCSSPRKPFSYILLCTVCFLLLFSYTNTYLFIIYLFIYLLFFYLFFIYFFSLFLFLLFIFICVCVFCQLIYFTLLREITITTFCLDLWNSLPSSQQRNIHCRGE